MDTATELTQLKKQFIQLKQQLDDLHQFISVEKLESGGKILHIQCINLMLRNPDSPEPLQGMLCAGDDGPQLSLWGSDGKARIILKVEKDERSIQLFQPELKLAEDIGLDNQRRPFVGVLDQGKPRAGLKTNDRGGVVTVVHDDGHTRAMMMSQEDSGDIMVVNADMKAAVKISSDGPGGRGFLTVNHLNGKAAVIRGSLPETGCIVLNDKRGKPTVCIPDPDDEG